MCIVNLTVFMKMKENEEIFKYLEESNIARYFGKSLIIFPNTTSLGFMIVGVLSGGV